MPSLGDNLRALKPLIDIWPNSPNTKVGQPSQMCTNSSWILLEFYKSNSVYYSGSRETSHLAYYFGTKKPLHSILESGQKYISLFPDLKKQNNFLLPKCQHCGGTLTLDKLWDWLLARLPWQLHGLAFEHALCDIPFAKFVMCPGNIMSFAVMLCVSRGIWVILLVCIAWRLHDVGGRAFFVPILCHVLFVLTNLNLTSFQC